MASHPWTIINSYEKSKKGGGGCCCKGKRGMNDNSACEIGLDYTHSRIFWLCFHQVRNIRGMNKVLASLDIKGINKLFVLLDNLNLYIACPIHGKKKCI